MLETSATGMHGDNKTVVILTFKNRLSQKWGIPTSQLEHCDFEIGALRLGSRGIATGAFRQRGIPTILPGPGIHFLWSPYILYDTGKGYQKCKLYYINQEIRRQTLTSVYFLYRHVWLVYVD